MLVSFASIGSVTTLFVAIAVSAGSPHRLRSQSNAPAVTPPHEPGRSDNFSSERWAHHRATDGGLATASSSSGPLTKRTTSGSSGSVGSGRGGGDRPGRPQSYRPRAKPGLARRYQVVRHFMALRHAAPYLSSVELAELEQLVNAKTQYTRQSHVRAALNAHGVAKTPEERAQERKAYVQNTQSEARRRELAEVAAVRAGALAVDADGHVTEVLITEEALAEAKRVSAAEQKGIADRKRARRQQHKQQGKKARAAQPQSGDNKRKRKPLKDPGSAAAAAKYRAKLAADGRMSYTSIIQQYSTAKMGRARLDGPALETFLEWKRDQREYVRLNDLRNELERRGEEVDQDLLNEIERCLESGRRVREYARQWAKDDHVLDKYANIIDPYFKSRARDTGTHTDKEAKAGRGSRRAANGEQKTLANDPPPPEQPENTMSKAEHNLAPFALGRRRLTVGQSASPGAVFSPHALRNLVSASVAVAETSMQNARQSLREAALMARPRNWELSPLATIIRAGYVPAARPLSPKPR